MTTKKIHKYLFWFILFIFFISLLNNFNARSFFSSTESVKDKLYLQQIENTNIKNISTVNVWSAKELTYSKSSIISQLTNKTITFTNKKNYYFQNTPHYTIMSDDQTLLFYTCKFNNLSTNITSDVNYISIKNHIPDNIKGYSQLITALLSEAGISEMMNYKYCILNENSSNSNNNPIVYFIASPTCDKIPIFYEQTQSNILDSHRYTPIEILCSNGKIEMIKIDRLYDISKKINKQIKIDTDTIVKGISRTYGSILGSPELIIKNAELLYFPCQINNSSWSMIPVCQVELYFHNTNQSIKEIFSLATGAIII